MFYAKSKPEETIEQHNNKLLESLSCIIELFGNFFESKEVELIKIAAKHHDLGKINYKFQKKIRIAIGKELYQNEEIEKFYQSKKYGEIPHGYLSPAFLNIHELKKHFDNEVELFALINSIYYHHSRDATFTATVICEVIENDLKKQLAQSENGYILSTGYLGRIFTANSQQIPEKKWLKYAVIKGMLNKLDYAASAGIDVEIDGKLDGKYIAGFVRAKYPRLREVQEYMMENHDKNLVVVASTGMGKTEASLLWLNKNKGFYTLPLKISINAIYKRIIGMDGNALGYSRTALLHSDALAYLVENESTYDDPIEKYYATRRFAYPLTICTVDQLFKFVYKYLGCEIILATLKYSKLIIDEIQAYSPEIVARIIYGLEIITQLGGKFAIVTATFSPIYEYFMQKEGIDYQKPPKPFVTSQSRHFASYCEGDFDYDEIIENGKIKKVLVICNTVKKAQNVYERLYRSNVGVHLLHSHFIRLHRNTLEESILKFTRDDGFKSATGIWVTTQIVEASLDIDFDMLYTEMAPADSLLQRFGRCYRSREYTGNTPNIKICNTQNYKGVYDKDIFDLSTEYISKYCAEIFSENKKIEYVNCVYSLDRLKNSKFFKAIEKELDEIKKLVPMFFKQEEAERWFRDIKSITVIPEQVFEKLKKSGELESIVAIVNNMSLPLKDRVKARDEIYKYTLSVNPMQYNMRGQKLIDTSKIDAKLDIYRINCKYEFDECKNQGRGLLYDNYVNQFQ